MQDAADLAALRQHWRDLANLARRADTRIVRWLQSEYRRDQEQTKAALDFETAEQWRLIRQTTVLLNVLAARLGPDPSEPNHYPGEA